MGFLGGTFDTNHKEGAATANKQNQFVDEGRNAAAAEYDRGEGRALGQYGTNYYDPDWRPS